MTDIFTVVQGSFQDGRRAAPPVSDSSEGQNLDLVEDVFAQTGQLDAVAGVALHRPEVWSGVRVFFLVDHLEDSQSCWWWFWLDLPQAELDLLC